MAVGLALLVHAIFAVILLNAQRTPHPPILPSLDVTLVYELPERVMDAPDIPPAREPEPAAEAIPQEPAITPAIADAAETEDSTQPVVEPTSARSTSEPVTPDADTNENLYILSPATQSVLRGLQCPGDPEAFARTGVCPQGAGRHTQMVASPESASAFYTIDVAAIRAMFGQSSHALAGQATLEDGTQRRSLSNADSMREMLPASNPDPAFGD